jgi:NADPH:quinone reductase-like Zn-dependent oxidoreductase
MTLAVTYRRPGLAADVLEVTDIGATPPPGQGQLQIQVTVFPIHPGDLLAVAGAPPRGESTVAGAEATGIVVAVGSGVSGFSLGDRVAFFPHAGAWAERVNVDASIAVAVPDAVPDEVAALMVCNPLTVLMLRRAAERHFSVGFDGVVLNNAAASSVGRLFTAGAERHRLATISIVRSDQRAQQLREEFAAVPVVSTSSPDWQDEVRGAAAGRLIPVALDPVGGSATADLLSLLSPGGTVYLYGALADADIVLHPLALLEDKSLHGVTIGRWLTAVSPEQRASDLAAAAMMVGGFARYLDSAAEYRIEQITDAVRASTRPGKVGTILVKP